MSEKGFKRKLTAIISADVVGYSRLMDDDEEATVRILNDYRSAMTTLIQQYSGRVVDTPGDNLLAEFASAVDAVNCVVEIQRELAKRNAELSDERKMYFRIGVNVGDVVEERDRIYGDGVNIAARLEGLAEGGGICISGTAYDQVKNKLPFSYEYQGEQTVKNIKAPLRVYTLLMEKDADDLISDKKLELPKRPSIAVLPFVNMSGDPNQEYLSDGITEEIITGISKIPKMFVIARNSTFTYKENPVKVQKVSEELGVQYVLEGSVRKAGNRIRITAQLVDAIVGHHLWAERYDRDLGDIFALQDEITMKILTALQVELTDGEQARVASKGTNSLEAYLKWLQAHEFYLRLNEDDNTLARRLSEEAIALDPDYAAAYTTLGWTHAMDARAGWGESTKHSLEQADKLAQKAVALDDKLPEARQLLGLLYLMKCQYEKSIAEHEKAIALNPNQADNHALLGMSLVFACRPEEAIVSLKRAIRLNPIPQSYYFVKLGRAYRIKEQYEEALASCKKALDQNPKDLFAYVDLAAIYILIGNEESARVAAAEVLKKHPKFSIKHFVESIPFKKQSENELLINVLRKAGLK
ncbi:MAG: adenylate/guanylate cyclase domain-containing protein [Desulfobacterales bacterium]|jgi:adenylate cyclase